MLADASTDPVVLNSTMQRLKVAVLAITVAGCGGDTLGDPDSGGGDAGGTAVADDGADETDGETATSMASAGSQETGQPPGGTDAPADSDGTGDATCRPTNTICVEADDQLACSDLGFPPECVDGINQCPPGWISFADCVCQQFVPRPTCLITDMGICMDITMPAVCVGTPGDGGWTCPRGTTQIEDCDFGGSESGTDGGSSTG